MEIGIRIVFGIGIIIVLLFLIRAFGAWMLRIDEVIALLKEIRDNQPKKVQDQLPKS